MLRWVTCAHGAGFLQYFNIGFSSFEIGCSSKQLMSLIFHYNCEYCFGSNCEHYLFLKTVLSRIAFPFIQNPVGQKISQNSITTMSIGFFSDQAENIILFRNRFFFHIAFSFVQNSLGPK